MAGNYRIYILYISLCAFGSNDCQFSVPGLNYEAYVNEGDINIGLLTYVHQYSSDSFCSEDTWMSEAHRTEIASYVTELINRDDTLLPNITLGFVVLDNCLKDLTALAMSMYFVRPAGDLIKADDRFHKVVGIVGPTTSRQSVMVASFLGLFQIPVLSVYATSDDLSDKNRFPYFMRLVPPDAFQAVAIVDILQHFNWTYVSLLYSEGSYGENAAKHIERLTKARGICLAMSKRISSDAGDDEIDRMVQIIPENTDAPVVIIFLESRDLYNIFRAVRRADLNDHFVWVAGDSFSSVQGSDVEDIGAGALYIDFPNGDDSDFAKYLRKQSWINSTNPWMPLVFESTFGCTWSERETNETFDEENSCSTYHTLDEADYIWITSVTKHIDGFIVYAKALHNLIAAHCPDYFRSDIRRNFSQCIKGHLLLEYMKELEFSGYSGPIAFDSKGDMKGKYVVKQHRWTPSSGFDSAVVGQWDRLSASLSISQAELDWGIQSKNLVLKPVESVCSRPCAAGQYYQQKEVPCCWKCIQCRNNEITNVNLTDCEACFDFTWPDVDTKIKCESIEPLYLHHADVIGTLLICVAAFGILIAIAIITIYIIKKNNRLIKATSRELSICILVGCMLACIISLLFEFYPSDIVCLLRQAGFHTVVCIMYTPLVAKTIRVYRIFTAGKRGTGRPKFISNKAQIIFISAIILIQVHICRYPSRLLLTII